MAKKINTSSYKEIMTEIRKNHFSPVYLLMGNEDYYIDKIADALEHLVVEDDEKDFNASISYGADTDIRQVIARAQQYPVMADRQLVMLKEGQTMFNSKNQLEKLVSYVNKPNPNTVLVIIYKGDSLADSSGFLKAMNDSGFIILKSERPKDPQLAGHVGEYCREKGIGIDDKGVSLLCEYIGSPLSKLFGEIDKLAVAAGSSKQITADLIQSLIGISKEYNTYELTKVISNRDYQASMRMLNYFSKNSKQNPGVIIIATLFKYFSKLFIASIAKDKSDQSLMRELDLKNNYALIEYRNGMRNYRLGQIDAIIHAIRETDTKSKGIGSTHNEYDLLKELIYKIFSVK